MKSLINVFALGFLLLSLAACNGSDSLKPSASVSVSQKQSVVMFATRMDHEMFPEPLATFVPYDLKEKVIGSSNKLQKSFSFGRAAVALGKSRHDKWGYHAVIVEPGSYLLHSAREEATNRTTTYTLGSFAFTVEPGETKYVGEIQYGLPNHKPMSVGEIGKSFFTAFFTLGLKGMPDPRIMSVVASQNDARMQATKEFFPNIKTDITKVELISDITFESKKVNLIYKAVVKSNEEMVFLTDEQLTCSHISSEYDQNSIEIQDIITERKIKGDGKIPKALTSPLSLLLSSAAKPKKDTTLPLQERNEHLKALSLEKDCNSFSDATK